MFETNTQSADSGGAICTHSKPVWNEKLLASAKFKGARCVDFFGEFDGLARTVELNEQIRGLD